MPDCFSNFQTSEKTFEKRAKNLIARRNKFKGLRLNGHVCDYCLSLFSTKYAKDRHIIHHHLNEKLVPCSLCKADFKKREGLAAHMKAKHRDKLEKFVCKICDAKFENKSSLKRHLVIIDHDAVMKVSFVCANCDKVFKTRTSNAQEKVKSLS